MSANKSRTTKTQVTSIPNTSNITAAGGAYTAADTALAVTAYGRYFKVTLKYQVTAAITTGCRIAVSGGTITSSSLRARTEGATALLTSGASSVGATSPLEYGVTGAVASGLAQTSTNIGVWEFHVYMNASSSVTFTPAYMSVTGGGITVDYRQVIVDVLE